MMQIMRGSFCSLAPVRLLNESQKSAKMPNELTEAKIEKGENKQRIKNLGLHMPSINART